MEVAHKLKARIVPPGVATSYDEAQRKKWSEQAARGDSDFDLDKDEKKVDKDCAAVPSPLRSFGPSITPAASSVWACVRARHKARGAPLVLPLCLRLRRAGRGSTFKLGVAPHVACKTSRCVYFASSFTPASASVYA